jgi:PAS domain S-box-containing protein
VLNWKKRYKRKPAGKIPIFDMTEIMQNDDRPQKSQREWEELVTTLKESEAKFRNIVLNAIEGVFQTDPGGRFTHANPSFARIHGYVSPDEIKNSILGKDLFVDPSDHNRLMGLLRTSNSVQNFEVQQRKKNGDIHWISMNVMVFRDENGKVLRYEGTMLDITNRKNAQKALLETEAKFRNIVDNAIEGIFQTDPRGCIIHANSSFVRIHGYDTRDEIKDSVFAKDLFVDPSDHGRLIDLLRASNSVQNFEARLRTKKGKVHWISMNVMVFRDENRKVIRYEGTMLDITKRKKAQKALLESEERYRVAIENSNDGILILRSDICQYANKQYIKMFAFDGPEEVIGKSIKPTIHPNDIEMVTDIIDRRQRGEPVPSRYEFKAVTKKGDTFSVEASAASITFRGRPFYLVYLRDVTERKRAEQALMKSHKELERLNKAKTKAVDHISHELKTPLAVIQGITNILKRKFEDALTPGFKDYIERLERNTERLVEISRETDEIFRVSQEVEAGMVLNDIDRLLERLEDLSEMPEAIRSHWKILKEWASKYLGGSPRLFQSVDLYLSIVSVVEKIKQTAAHRNLQFKVEGQNDLFIFMDPFILREVAEALIKNAIENTPAGGIIEVSAEQNDAGIVLLVADRGIGITEENQASLLDGLFHTEETDLYSTKKPFEFGAGGKGLELLRIRHYAERYGFDISLTSKRCIYIPTDRDVCPGDIARCNHCKTVDDCKESGGTTFAVTFPVGTNSSIIDKRK